MLISKTDLNNMSSRYRATFINSIEGFKSVNLIGTRSKLGVSNLAPFNSIVHIGSSPSYIGFIVRPETDEHQTLKNIRETSYYSINHIHEGIVNEAHQTSAKYDEHTSEFDVCGFTEQESLLTDVPYVKESNVKYMLKLREIVPIALNGTSLVIGEIQEIILGECKIEEDGFVHIEELGTITCIGVDAYFKTEAIGRIAYAKK